MLQSKTPLTYVGGPSSDTIHYLGLTVDERLTTGKANYPKFSLSHTCKSTNSIYTFKK